MSYYNLRTSFLTHLSIINKDFFQKKVPKLFFCNLQEIPTKRENIWFENRLHRFSEISNRTKNISVRFSNNFPISWGKVFSCFLVCSTNERDKRQRVSLITLCPLLGQNVTRVDNAPNCQQNRKTTQLFTSFFEKTEDLNKTAHARLSPVCNHCRTEFSESLTFLDWYDINKAVFFENLNPAVPDRHQSLCSNLRQEHFY